MPAFDDVPLVSAAATYDAENKLLYVSVVNCAVDAPIRLELAGIEVAGEVEMSLVAGEHPLTTNDFAAPQRVAIEQRQAHADDLELPPHSFALLRVPLG